MSSILPPSNRLWWKESIDKTEWTWIGIAFVWGMIMFVMMIYWHIYGKQNLSNEAYKTTPEMFAAKAEKFIAENTIRKETDQDIPVVKVPAGGDGYLIARLFLAAAGEHQHPGDPGLRARRQDDADLDRHLRHRL